MNEKHQRLTAALKSGSYDSLWVRRHGRDCWFMVKIDGAIEGYVNERGECPQYRHVWQIRKWLRESFGIAPEKVEVMKDS